MHACSRNNVVFVPINMEIWYKRGSNLQFPKNRKKPINNHVKTVVTTMLIKPVLKKDKLSWI